MHTSQFSELARRAAALVALLSTALAVGATSTAKCPERQGAGFHSGPAFELAGTTEDAESTFVFRAGDAEGSLAEFFGDVTARLEFTPPASNPDAVATLSLRLQNLPAAKTEHVVVNLSRQDGLQQMVSLPLPLESRVQPDGEEEFRLAVTRLFANAESGPVVVKWEVAAAARSYPDYAEPCDDTPLPIEVDFAP